MDGKQDAKRVEVRLRCIRSSQYGKILDYLVQQNRSTRELILESLLLLWEPYVLAEHDLPLKEVEKLVESSYQRCLNHYQLMRISLGLISVSQPDSLGKRSSYYDSVNNQPPDNLVELKLAEEVETNTEIISHQKFEKSKPKIRGGINFD